LKGILFSVDRLDLLSLPVDLLNEKKSQR